MCGRFTISASKDEIQKYLQNYFSIFDFNIDNYYPRYNVAPSQDVLTILNDGKNYRAGFIKWGFVPEFAKDDKAYNLINARSETIDTKPSFRNSFLNKRLIIPVDSFYEWKNTNNNKIPMRIMMKDSNIFALAGIWSTYIRKDNSKLFTFSILTTEANPLVNQIHNRMPVIIEKDNIATWLDPKVKDPKLLKSLLLPYDQNMMTLYEVSNEVNNPKNDFKDLLNNKNQALKII